MSDFFAGDKSLSVSLYPDFVENVEILGFGHNDGGGYDFNIYQKLNGRPSVS
jgi:hypothetical protein